MAARSLELVVWGVTLVTPEGKWVIGLPPNPLASPLGSTVTPDSIVFRASMASFAARARGDARGGAATREGAVSVSDDGGAAVTGSGAGAVLGCGVVV